MPSVSTTTTTTTSVVAGDADVRRLLDEAARVDGRFPLSDHLRLELERGGQPGFAAVTARSGDVLTGYAQVAAVNGVRNIELVVDPAARDDPTISSVLLTRRPRRGRPRRWRPGAVVGPRRRQP